MEEMIRKFKVQAEGFFLQFKALEQYPHKGKVVGNVGAVVIKEFKCGKHRFYFITDGYILKFGSPPELGGLLIKFVRLLEKKDQEKTIGEMKRILHSTGLEGF